MISHRDWSASALEAMLRARGRVRLQELGETEADLPEGVSLAAAGMLTMPHELLPYERLRHQVMGKRWLRGERPPRVRSVLR